MSAKPTSASNTDSDAINLYLPSSDSKSKSSSSKATITNPLPGLIQTPSGLALLELQGKINTPADDAPEGTNPVTELGTISFPEYDPQKKDSSDTAWMKKVWMFIGKHQRLTGEVKKLPTPLGIVRRRTTVGGKGGVIVEGEDGDENENDLEMVEVVKYKIVFSQRPEPVTESLWS